MTGDGIEEAGADVLRRLGPHALRSVAGHTAMGWPREAVIRATPGTEALLEALGRP